MSLIEEISTRLQALEPTRLEITDESHLHAGHQENKGGRHIKLVITSSHFCGKSQIMRHRLVYQILADLITQHIHALSIQALTPDEA